jgi:hypothetical protein
MSACLGTLGGARRQAKARLQDDNQNSILPSYLALSPFPFRLRHRGGNSVDEWVHLAPVATGRMRIHEILEDSVEYIAFDGVLGEHARRFERALVLLLWWRYLFGSSGRAYEAYLVGR